MASEKLQISAASFRMPEYNPPSAWLGHGPFAFWLIENLRPKRFVELGTHHGFSYFVFCQAIQLFDCATSAYAVDTWEGDHQAGHYSDEVFARVSAVNAQYRDFSNLLRARFDEAVSLFEDKSIDLLHIDGLHTYEAASVDFATWSPKLSDNAVVLFHDTNVRNDDFGVWQLFGQLAKQYPTFEFTHGHGLGVVCPGTAPPDCLSDLLDADPKMVGANRAAYAALGASIETTRSLRLVQNGLRELCQDDASVSRQKVSSIADEAEEYLLYLVGSINVDAIEKLSRSVFASDRQQVIIEGIRRVLSVRCGRNFYTHGVHSDSLATLTESEKSIVEDVRQTGLFDTNYYLSQYNDIKVSGVDPLVHFALTGWNEGRNPSPFIDVKNYLLSYPDVKATGMNPVVHYAEFGIFEGRDPALTHIASDASIKRSAASSDPQPALLEDAPSRDADKDLKTFLRSQERITFTTQLQPKVTVLIVLRDEPTLTYKSLKALRGQADVEFEVILIDNGSTGETQKLLERIDGVRIVKCDEKGGVLNGYDRGASVAKATALLLLGNDASVREAALSAALATLRSDPAIGAVGGRLILPSGLLNEAGNIIWADGSTIAYGQGYHGDHGAVTFRRDVDYCSSAFLLVDLDIWRRLDGFDEIFASTRYQDADFCMRLRDAGYRVVYEPRATVDHFVFANEAADPSAQGENVRSGKAFRLRHSATLRRSHLPPGQANIVEARYRHAGEQRRALVVDSGGLLESCRGESTRAQVVLNAVARLDWFVTLYPLQDAGVDRRASRGCIDPTVEIMSGSGVSLLANFLEERLGYYDVIIVNRQFNMRILNDILEERPHLAQCTRVIYDAGPVLSEREVAKASVLGRPMSQTRAAAMVADEIAVASSADAIACVNEAEASIFRDKTTADVYVLSHAVNRAETGNSFADRRGFLFVGRLLEKDAPNWHGLSWFIREVWPQVRRALPGANFQIAGLLNSSHEEFERPGVEFPGPVDDMESLYESTRVFIAPIQYAAGIPVKIIEAAAAGVPVVGTPLMARQLSWVSGQQMMVGENAASFAQAAVHLHEDEERWCKMRDAALASVARDFSAERFSNAVRDILIGEGALRDPYKPEAIRGLGSVHTAD